MVTISVIVPVYLGREPFQRCLDSLLALDPPPSEIIVVADGEPDGSRAYAEAKGVEVVKLDGPNGPAMARNAGARIAKGEVLFFVDADVTVPADTIARLGVCFDSHPHCSAIIGSYDDAPADRQFLSQYRNLLHHYVHQQAETRAWTFWGACGAIHREAFWAVGGFDERFRRPSIEDIELGYRLRRAGYEILLAKSLLVKHWKRWTLVGMVRTDLCDRALPWTALILEDRQLPNDLNVNLAARWSGVLVVLALLALLLAPWWPGFVGVACASFAGVLVLNGDLYRFFWRQRGFGFMLRVIPVHALYYAYGSLAFALGVVRHSLQRWRRRRVPPWTPSKSAEPCHPEG